MFRGKPVDVGDADGRGVDGSGEGDDGFGVGDGVGDFEAFGVADGVGDSHGEGVGVGLTEGVRAVQAGMPIATAISMTTTRVGDARMGARATLCLEP